MVERSRRRREMKDMATTRMLFMTALLAAVAVLLASPAQASWKDEEGGGGSGTAVVTPNVQPGSIPYLSHGTGVDESLFAGQPAVTSTAAVDELDPAIRRAIEAHKAKQAEAQSGPIPYLSHGMGVDESLFPGQQRVVQAAVAFDGSPDAIDRYLANQQTTTLPLGGSPDAIDRFLENQQSSTLTLGGSPDAIDRYMGRTSVAAQGGTSGNDFDWTWVGLGAGLCGLLAAAMTGLYLSTRQRGRVALP